MTELPKHIWQPGASGRCGRGRRFRAAHENRRYVKSGSKRGWAYPEAVRRVLCSLALAAVWAAPAQAETVFAGPVSDARLAVGADGQPVVAYAAGGTLSLAVRGGGTWPAATIGLPGSDTEIDGLAVAGSGAVSVLCRERSGSWLELVTQTARSLGRQLIRPDVKDGVIGPAGLAVDRRGRPVVAYALWLPSHRTYLRLVRVDARGRLTTSAITKGGFPSTTTLAGAAPVVLPSGKVRVVETYKPAAIDWFPIPGGWKGQFLHSSALGIPTGRVEAAANGSVVFAAWTEAFPTLGSPTVVLAVHAARTFSGVVLENAVLADLLVTPGGAELAANRCVADAVCEALVDGHELDGIVAGYAAEAGGGRQVLLDGPGGLAWYRSPSTLSVAVSLTLANGQLAGRVSGAQGGSVDVYRELSGGARTRIATVPLAPDGSFAASDPTLGPAAPAAYRAVYVASDGIPYGALVSTGAAPLPQR